MVVESQIPKEGKVPPHKKINEVMCTRTTALHPFRHLFNSDNMLPRLSPVPSAKGYLDMLYQQYTVSKLFTKFHVVAELFHEYLESDKSSEACFDKTSRKRA